MEQINFELVDMSDKDKEQLEFKKKLFPFENRLDQIEFLEKKIHWKQPPEERPKILEELQIERNKLNRQISTLKKASIKA